MDENKITADELYEIRKSQLEAQRLNLAAQLAQNKVQEILLQIEKKYKLLGNDVQMDIRTGIITRKMEDGAQPRE